MLTLRQPSSVASKTHASTNVCAQAKSQLGGESVDDDRSETKRPAFRIARFLAKCEMKLDSLRCYSRNYFNLCLFLTFPPSLAFPRRASRRAGKSPAAKRSGSLATSSERKKKKSQVVAARITIT